MMNLDEDAVICDLAETYGIFDWTSLPLSTVATLAIGLPDGSRIKQKILRKSTNEEPLDTNTILMARAVDLLALLVWSRTKDASKGKNRPSSVLDALLGRNQKGKQKEEDKPRAFDTPEDFLRTWKEMGGG